MNNKLPTELINKIIQYVPHPLTFVMNDLISYCYDEEKDHDESFYNYYFRIRCKYYEGPNNRYGNIEYLFNIDNYYNNYKDD